MNISYEALTDVFYQILLRYRFSEERSAHCARIFADNTRDGAHSHGVNRFPVFIKMVQEGRVIADAEPVVESRFGVTERWNGQLAPGMWTASKAMERAIALAKEFGMSCVAVNNTNHWMRGGTYGFQAAAAGCIAICGTNAIANMPPWGGKEARLANNPLVIAVPRADGPVVLDMAMSQYSYGKLQEYRLEEKKLPFPGGFDGEGRLSVDPAAIYASRRPLPIGYWKGSGLSMMMDLLTAGLSGGRTVKQITESGAESGVSQFFICMDAHQLQENIVEEILEYAKSSEPVEAGKPIRFPGEQTLSNRENSLRHGIDIHQAAWDKILAL